MAVSLYAVDRGFMDDVELNKLGTFEAALVDSLGATRAALMGKLDAGDWNDDLEAQLKVAVTEFKASGSW
jgi:F-type H+-transporting ATPase subunit alpha